MNGLRSWLVIRYHVERNCWTEVGCTDAPTAGDAFRHVVMKPNQIPDARVVGEYRVLTLDDSAHLAIEFNLRDLDAKSAVV